MPQLSVWTTPLKSLFLAQHEADKLQGQTQQLWGLLWQPQKSQKWKKIISGVWDVSLKCCEKCFQTCQILHWGGGGAPKFPSADRSRGKWEFLQLLQQIHLWVPLQQLPGITNRHKSTFSRMDRQLLSQVDASALFCCDIIWDFKGSKAKTAKITFLHSFRKWKNSLSLIYENISSEEAAKQQAKRENSEVKHRQHEDKEANETVLKENRS